MQAMLGSAFGPQRYMVEKKQITLKCNKEICYDSKKIVFVFGISIDS